MTPFFGLLTVSFFGYLFALFIRPFACSFFAAIFLASFCGYVLWSVIGHIVRAET